MTSILKALPHPPIAFDGLSSELVNDPASSGDRGSPTMDALTLPGSIIGREIVLCGYPSRITHLAHKGKLATVEEIEQELRDEQSEH